MKDEEGYYTHQGRNDDLIKVDQKFMGPYEVEGVICTHPAVLESAVIAKGTNVGRPTVKAFVQVRPGVTRLVAAQPRDQGLCAGQPPFGRAAQRG